MPTSLLGSAWITWLGLMVCVWGLTLRCLPPQLSMSHTGLLAPPSLRTCCLPYVIFRIFRVIWLPTQEFPSESSCATTPRHSPTDPEGGGGPWIMGRETPYSFCVWDHISVSRPWVGLIDSEKIPWKPLVIIFTSDESCIGNWTGILQCSMDLKCWFWNRINSIQANKHIKLPVMERLEKEMRTIA